MTLETHFSLVKCCYSLTDVPLRGITVNLLYEWTVSVCVADTVCVSDIVSCLILFLWNFISFESFTVESEP